MPCMCKGQHDGHESGSGALCLGLLAHTTLRQTFGASTLYNKPPESRRHVCQLLFHRLEPALPVLRTSSSKSKLRGLAWADAASLW
jgi:hypothetical protein